MCTEKILFVSSFLALSAAVVAQPSQWDGGKPCSTEKVNRSCTITIDRLNPLQPPTLQMYPNAIVTVNFANGLDFESPSLDWQGSTAVAMPDPIATIFTALNSTFAKVAAVISPGAVKARIAVANKESNDFCNDAVLADSESAFKCVLQIAAEAKAASPKFSLLVNPDSVVPPGIKYDGNFSADRQDAVCAVFGARANDLNDSEIRCPDTSHDLNAEQGKVAAWVTANSKDPAISDLTVLASYTSGLVSTLSGFAENLVELKISVPTQTNASQKKDSKTVIPLGVILDPGRAANPKDKSMPKSCNASITKDPDSTNYKRLVQRQVVCAVNVINSVANSSAAVPTAQLKKAVVAITVNYAETRIETSAGILLSALPSRSFSAASTYTGTPPTVSKITATETDTKPLVVPFAAVNVLLHDWLWGLRRGGIYATGLAGVNPNTTTADAGAGLSLSWRSLMISPVAHFAHDVKLTSGIYVNENLGPKFSGSLPTKQFWTTSWGVGLSYRIPLIPGR